MKLLKLMKENKTKRKSKLQNELTINESKTYY